MVKRNKISAAFRSQFSEKLMDLGNLSVAALVFGQFVSGKEFSPTVFIAGMIIMSVCYVGSYSISK